MSKVEIVVAGRPAAVIEDRGLTVAGIDGRYRFRAMLRGRSAGGHLTGHGATADAALAELTRVYKAELAAVKAARRRLAELTAQEGGRR
jgi:hypothetical protein